MKNLFWAIYHQSSIIINHDWNDHVNKIYTMFHLHELRGLSCSPTESLWKYSIVDFPPLEKEMVANACQYIHCTKTTALCWIFDQLTLEGTNISHQKKRKVIFESTWVVDMLLSWRVLYTIKPFMLSKTKPIYNKFLVDSFLQPSPCGEFPFQRRFPELRCGPVTQTQYRAVIGRGEGPLPAKAATQNLQGTTVG